MTLHLHQLTYRIHQKSLIENISLIFQPGTLYGILGPNGSGKSTLLRTISRILKPTHGTLTWQGHNLLNFSRLEMSRTISLVPQNPPYFFDFDVYQIVAMGCYSSLSHSSKSSQRIEIALRQTNVWHLRDQHLSRLSGGEVQRVYIARALVTEAHILLLDEPTSYLDLRHQLEIWKLLHLLVKEGKVIIVTLHDLSTAQRFCDQLVILHQGHVQARGSYADIMTPKLLGEIFGIVYHENLEHFELINTTT